jgi:U3 small nucleolar RNA-associated protein 18
MYFHFSDNIIVFVSCGLVPHLPIHSASFLGDSGSVIVSGRRSFFYVYDTIEGKIDKIPKIHGREEKSLEKFATSPDGSFIAFIGNDGYIILVDGKTKSWIGDYKMNGSARAVSFTPCSGFIVASGSDGDVYR